MSYDGLNEYQTSGMPYVFPGITRPEESKKQYLDTLDSDTRAYVMNHTDSECSRADLEACVNHLKGYH